MTNLIRLAISLVLILSIAGCDGQVDSNNSTSAPDAKLIIAANESSPNEGGPLAHASSKNDLEDVEDGEFDCKVKNLTRNEGPYTLTCEKDSDEITIHFPNGGYIVTDLDGLHASTGEIWQIEEN